MLLWRWSRNSGTNYFNKLWTDHFWMLVDQQKAIDREVGEHLKRSDKSSPQAALKDAQLSFRQDEITEQMRVFKSLDASMRRQIQTDFALPSKTYSTAIKGRGGQNVVNGDNAKPIYRCAEKLSKLQRGQSGTTAKTDNSAKSNRTIPPGPTRRS